MAQAEHAPTTRRSVLAGAIALTGAAGGTAVTIATARASDANAAALLIAFEAAWGRHEGLDHHDEAPVATAASDASYERLSDLIDAIDAAPAASREARLAKAMVIAWLEREEMIGPEDDRAGLDLIGRLAFDIRASLLGAAPAAGAASHPDAALLACWPEIEALLAAERPLIDRSFATEDAAHDLAKGRCRRYPEACLQAEIVRAKTEVGFDAADAAATRALDATRSAVQRARAHAATTLAGLRMKARIASHYPEVADDIVEDLLMMDGVPDS